LTEAGYGTSIVVRQLTTNGKPAFSCKTPVRHVRVTDPYRQAPCPVPAQPHSVLRFRRLLLTGAAGGLGRELRPRLARYCETLRVSDIAELAPPGPGEEVVHAPLQDKAAVGALLDGVDAVVHLGGVSVERPFEEILPANIVGTYHVYEAARVHGVPRIVFASSNHVTGFYKQSQTIDATMPMRPDGYYGLSKAYGENLAQFYWDRWGIETVSLRIGSSFPEPKDRRMLATWMSYDDLERLVVAALTAPVVGHSVVYGISDNHTAWYDNTPARHIGYRPQDSSERFRATVEARQPLLDREDPAVVYQGGAFVKQGPFD
jgi:uronate dehydrogenase